MSIVSPALYKLSVVLVFSCVLVLGSFSPCSAVLLCACCLLGGHTCLVLFASLVSPPCVSVMLSCCPVSLISRLGSSPPRAAWRGVRVSSRRGAGGRDWIGGAVECEVSVWFGSGRGWCPVGRCLGVWGVAFSVCTPGRFCCHLCQFFCYLHSFLWHFFGASFVVFYSLGFHSWVSFGCLHVGPPLVGGSGLVMAPVGC